MVPCGMSMAATRPHNRLCAFTVGILSGRAAGTIGEEW
jgi:hypothetical protein